MKRGVIVILAGLVVLVGTVGTAFAVMAIWWPPASPEGVIDLAPWLRLELAAGSAGAIAAGFVGRRIGRSRTSPLVLAGIVGGLGLRSPPASSLLVLPSA